MKKTLSIICFAILIKGACAGQGNNYLDSLLSFRQHYINGHEVVKDTDRLLLEFFPLDEKYCVPARFEKVYESPWFPLETSGKVKKVFRVYGILHFKIGDTALKLYVYQSQRQFREPGYDGDLFIPFTDKTNGEESYENGRYIDLLITDLGKPGFCLDFNKAYNPYCAYISD